MEELLKSELGCSSVKSCGGAAQGCINNGSGFLVDDKKVFVKSNRKNGARLMFDGEFASLAKINETETVRVPRPIKVFEKGNECYFVAEYLDMHSLSKQAGKLGEKVALMHLHNQAMKNSAKNHENFIGRKIIYVDKFGFDVTTCCGFLPTRNDWMENWVEFYAQNKLLVRVSNIETNTGDRDLKSLWPQVERNISKLFPADLNVVPSLLHGDLWSGNAAEVDSEPCIFDAGSFYGHSEFELSISHMFGGFSSQFFTSYHALIPKAPGFDKRQTLYQLFHYLNHWDHFGSGYKSQSISLMQEIAKL